MPIGTPFTVDDDEEEAAAEEEINEDEDGDEMLTNRVEEEGDEDEDARLPNPGSDAAKLPITRWLKLIFLFSSVVALTLDEESGLEIEGVEEAE